MATRMTVNGVNTTTTPGTEQPSARRPYRRQYEVFYTGYGTRQKSTTNTTIATPMGNCSPAWLIPSKSADNGVMNG